MNNLKTVLVVDDSRVSRMMSRQYILAIHPEWSVEEAVSGEDALEKVKNLSPSMIILDVNMPGMGGLAAAEKLRAMCPETPITLLTANVQDATRNRANAIGVGFAEKPITEARIRQMLAGLES